MEQALVRSCIPHVLSVIACWTWIKVMDNHLDIVDCSKMCGFWEERGTQSEPGYTKRLRLLPWEEASASTTHTTGATLAGTDLNRLSVSKKGGSPRFEPHGFSSLISRPSISLTLSLLTGAPDRNRLSDIPNDLSSPGKRKARCGITDLTSVRDRENAIWRA